MKTPFVKHPYRSGTSGVRLTLTGRAAELRPPVWPLELDPGRTDPGGSHPPREDSVGSPSVPMGTSPASAMLKEDGHYYGLLSTHSSLAASTHQPQPT